MNYSQKYMSEGEMALLWDKVTCNRHRLIFKCLFYLGCRVSEVLRIKISDINLQDKTLVIPRQKNKRLINELIMIPQPIIKPLKDYLAFYEQEILDSNGYIFFSPRRKGYPISLSGMESIFRRIRINAGLSNNTAYLVAKNGHKYHRICLHTHKNESIRHIYNLTRDLRMAQAQGHHTNMNSTLRYLGNPLMDMQLKKDISNLWN